MAHRAHSASMLVVDDDAVSLRLAAGLLQQAFPGHQVHTSDGTDALEQIEKYRPRLVLTDLYMPRTDGLKLLEEARKRHPELPVVVMTAHGSEQAAVRALRAGAASYVPKQRLAEELAETVRWVLAVRAQHQRHVRVFDFLTRVERTFVLPNQTDLIPPLVTELQGDLRRLDVCPEEDLVRFGVAMTEALMNAVIHGNLGLPGRLLDGGHAAFAELVKQRRSSLPYAERKVVLEMRATRQEVVCVVRDEGEGFDPGTLADPTDEQAMVKTHGRGLLLMRTFMDEVRFNERGNEVTLVKRSRLDNAGQI